MRIAKWGLRLFPVAVVLVLVSMLATTPASAQCYGPSYGGYGGYPYYPSYDYSWGSGSWDYGYDYPYDHGYGVRYHSYRPYYRGYRHGFHWRGYPSYYGGYGAGFGYVVAAIDGGIHRAGHRQSAIGMNGRPWKHSSWIGQEDVFQRAWCGWRSCWRGDRCRLSHSTVRRHAAGTVRGKTAAVAPAPLPARPGASAAGRVAATRQTSPRHTSRFP